MSVHKSTFWGPFFALVAFTICVGTYKWIEEMPERELVRLTAEAETKRLYQELGLHLKTREALDSIKAYDDSIKVIGDSIRRAEFVKDSTTRVIRLVANRQRTKVEQCKFWAWGDTSNFGNEEQAERDCLRRNNGN